LLQKELNEAEYYDQLLDKELKELNVARIEYEREENEAKIKDA